MGPVFHHTIRQDFLNFFLPEQAERLGRLHANLRSPRVAEHLEQRVRRLSAGGLHSIDFFLIAEQKADQNDRITLNHKVVRLEVRNCRLGVLVAALAHLGDL